MNIRNLALALTGCVALNGCALATIPLTMAASNAITDNTMSRAEAIPNMNCAQLRERWASIQSPLAMANPFQMTAAERSLVRQTASRKGCGLS